MHLFLYLLWWGYTTRTPRAVGTFCSPPGAVRDAAGTGVLRYSALRCALCMAAMRWPRCRLLPPHEMASPAAHRQCCCTGKMSCLVALQGTQALHKQRKGMASWQQGRVTGTLGSLHSPSSVASPAAALRARQTACPTRGTQHPTSKPLFAQGAPQPARCCIPACCHRPRGCCHGLQGRAHEPGTTASPTARPTALS